MSGFNASNGQDDHCRLGSAAGSVWSRQESSIPGIFSPSPFIQRLHGPVVVRGVEPRLDERAFAANWPPRTIPAGVGLHRPGNKRDDSGPISAGRRA